MLEEGLSYPSKGELWIGRFVIGSTLLFFGWLLVPLLPLYGYLVRVLASAAAGDEEPPRWERWGELTINGIKAVFVTFVYGLIPNVVAGIVIAVVFFIFLGGGVVGGEEGGALAGLGLLASVVGVLFVLFVQLVVAYLVPGALINFAAADSVRAAFDLGELSDLVLSVEYLLAMVQPLFVWFVVLVVGALVSVTVILPPLVIFWGAVAVAWLFGTAYRKSVGPIPSGRRAPVSSGSESSSERESPPTPTA